MERRYPENVDLIKSLCRQAGKLLKQTQLPQQVDVLMEVFPYAASLACAHGMWHIMHPEDNAGPFHEDRLMFSAVNALGHRLDIGEVLEPYPFEEFYYNSSFKKEIEYCFALGMMYETAYLEKEDSIWTRLRQLSEEYDNWEEDAIPRMSCDECRQLKTRYDEEIQAFKFAVGYIPGVVGEKRKAIEHCCEHIEINSH